jgi:hypothetical protein
MMSKECILIIKERIDFVMKKPIYKVLSVLALSLMLVNPIHANAEEILNGDSAGDKSSVMISEQQQIAIGLKKASSEQQVNDLLMKKAVIDRSQAKANIAATYTAATISVTYYKQENGYYCGPATTKQTIQYLNGTSDSQSTIATALGTTTDGTDGTKIVDYLNNKQSKIYWTIASDTSTSGLQTRISASITGTTKRPPVARTKFSKGGNWKYATAGHFMNISGYSANMEKVRVTDPNIGRVDSSATGSYYVTMDEMYNAINDHWAKHLYW